MMRSRTCFVLLMSLLLLLFVGLVGAQEPMSGGSLSVVFSSEWGVLDPAANTNTFGRNIMQFIYDPLLRKHPTSALSCRAWRSPSPSATTARSSH